MIIFFTVQKSPILGVFDKKNVKTTKLRGWTPRKIIYIMLKSWQYREVRWIFPFLALARQNRMCMFCFPVFYVLMFSEMNSFLSEIARMFVRGEVVLSYLVCLIADGSMVIILTSAMTVVGILAFGGTALTGIKSKSVSLRWPSEWRRNFICFNNILSFICYT